MAHEIEMVNGKAKMAFIGKVPWHAGETNPTELTEADQYDWPTVCTKAGLDTDVEKVPLVTSDTQAKVDHFAIRRVQDGKILGTVGARYHPLQNRDAFKWF